MTVTTVTTDNFIKETVLFIRDLLTAQVSDPIPLKRGINEKFILTGYPERPVSYPIITIRKENLSSQKLGFQSELQLLDIPIEIRVWARNTAEKDNITQNIINALRDNQTTTSTGSIQAKLYNFRINNSTDVDEDGLEGIKSCITSVNYKFILGA
jgi:hypothetical protein